MRTFEEEINIYPIYDDLAKLFDLTPGACQSLVSTHLKEKNDASPKKLGRPLKDIEVTDKKLIELLLFLSNKKIPVTHSI